MRTGTSKDTSLEALRGLAALNVVAGHFLLTFFPYLGNYLWNSRTITQRVVSQRFEFESWLGAAPFTILFNGTFPVCIFFVLSGYVLSWKFIEQGDHAYLRASALKRFPRLVAPVFASVLFAWALLTLGVMRTTEAAAIGAASFLSEAYNQPVSLMSALWIGAIGAPLLGQTTINVPLWTIKIELLGSFLLFAVYAMSGSKSPLLALAAFLILLIGFIPGSANIIFFSGFIAGSLLHYIKPPIGGRIWISLALIIAGLIAGGFDYSPLYYWLDDIKLPDIAPVITDIHGSRMNLYYMAGAICLVAGFVSTPRLVRVLCHPFFAHLGRLSFSMYLVHWPIICSLSLSIVALGLSEGLSYLPAVGASAIVTLPAVMLAAALFSRFVDQPA
ncbi:MAG: acyltransferase family protein, partial [Microvirga sp.]